ncbi:hydrolase [Nitrosopumilus sp. K4]|uniref:hydrolase n=1 Tax=Nitrosopumilus sp. K4 TaxID=2795383 RepID=UPI001BACFB9E|nr:hydrolase [Nitrosopumilus sp. K4]QUC65446.1 hydrolase [Nitrosopumilus sp. K4]
MSEKNKDELIEAQNQVIGILFEVIKRFQANNTLDDEYFQIISLDEKSKEQEKRIKEIQHERSENGKIISRLLSQLEI